MSDAPRQHVAGDGQPLGQTRPIPSSSLAFRPKDYFGRYDLQHDLMTHVKGSFRRRHLRAALDAGDIHAVPEPILRQSLSRGLRMAVGAYHPSFMGGEYLPDLEDGELEIARIAIQSTTGDVVCLYARPLGRRIAYRMADEYGGDTLSGDTSLVTLKPLTFGRMVRFFLGAWNLMDCLEANFDDDIDGMHDFFEGESEYYPSFDFELRKRVRRRFKPSREEALP